MKDKTQNKNIFQVNDQKNPTLALSRRTFDVLDTFLFFFFCLFVWGSAVVGIFFFLICFQGGFLGEKFLKMEASSKPPQPQPNPPLCFLLLKKKKKGQKKKKTKPHCLYPSPSTRKASLGVRSHLSL